MSPFHRNENIYKVYPSIPFMPSTTIKISKDTKDRLDKIKEHSKESYDEAIRKILYILNTCKINPLKAKKILKGIEMRRMKNSKIFHDLFPEHKEKKE